MWLLLLACQSASPPTPPTPSPTPTVEVPELVPAAPVVPGRRPKEIAPAFRRDAVASRQTFSPHIVRDPDGPVPGTPTTAASDDPRIAVARELAALGYVDGEVDASPDSQDGVTVHIPERAGTGFNLMAFADGSSAQLIDMEGTVRHAWAMSVQETWPEFRGLDDEPEFYRRAVLMPNGDLVVIWSGYGIARITKESRLRWAHFLPVHHDLHVFDDGRVVTLTRKLVEIPRIEEEQPLLEDHVTYLAADGSVERTFSVLEAFEKYAGWTEVWNARPRKDRDLFHTNTMFVIERDRTDLHPAFRKGNLLTSMRHLEVLAVIDPVAEAVVWHFDDSFQRQHDPQLLDNGHLLVFDNYGGVGGTSRILEYALPGGELQWSYAAHPPELFSTIVCGHAQRLANGNTLINESSDGRAFEVTAKGEVVWNYRTPKRVRTGRVARLNELTRVDASFLPWLGGG